MEYKTICICVVSLFMQKVSSQCIQVPQQQYPNFTPLNQNSFSSGGGFTVTSTSAIAPTGLKVLSELGIEGPLNVGGNLPLLGAVALEGQLPAKGQASTTYSCGNGNIGITNEFGGNANPNGAQNNGNYGPNNGGYGGPNNAGNFGGPNNLANFGGPNVANFGGPNFAPNNVGPFVNNGIGSGSGSIVPCGN